MDTLYTWIDANIERLKYILSANFMVLSVVLVMVRFFDGGAVFTTSCLLVVVCSGYAMVCGSFVVIKFRNLKIYASRATHFGDADFDFDDRRRDPLATKIVSLPNRTGHPVEKFLTWLIGLPLEELRLTGATYQDFEVYIEGGEIRAVLATFAASFCFCIAVMSFVIGVMFT